jgi:hypothetical protein
VDSKVTFGTTRLWKDSSRPLISSKSTLESTSDQIWNHLHISKQCRRRAVASFFAKQPKYGDLIIAHQLSCVAEEQIQQVMTLSSDAAKFLSRITAVSRDLTKVSPQGKIHVPFTRAQIYRTGVTLQSHSRFFWAPDCAT